MLTPKAAEALALAAESYCVCPLPPWTTRIHKVFGWCQCYHLIWTIPHPWFVGKRMDLWQMFVSSSPWHWELLLPPEKSKCLVAFTLVCSPPPNTRGVTMMVTEKITMGRCVICVVIWCHMMILTGFPGAPVHPVALWLNKIIYKISSVRKLVFSLKLQSYANKACSHMNCAYWQLNSVSDCNCAASKISAGIKAPFSNQNSKSANATWQYCGNCAQQN